MNSAPEVPILYSFRRCPYAMRARWALLEAGLLVQWREIALKAKPAEMLAVSPKGTVPVLVLPDGSVIEESLAVMHWALDQADPRELRNTGDASALIEQNDGPFKHHLDRFKYTERYPGTNKDEQRAAGNVSRSNRLPSRICFTAVPPHELPWQSRQAVESGLLSWDGLFETRVVWLVAERLDQVW